jgi:hypothetical protein
MLEISGESWDSNSAEDYQSLSEHSIMTVTSCGSTMEPHSDHLESSFNRNNDRTHGNYDSDNTSENSEHSKPSLETNAASSQTKNRDDIPNTFLALKGISIANFNMGCNFHIAAALKLIADYDISILAIQEHTPWNKELSHIEITCIERSCENAFLKLSSSWKGALYAADLKLLQKSMWNLSLLMDSHAHQAIETVKMRIKTEFFKKCVHSVII